MARFQLLPEWEAQSGVLLTWPHPDTDWRQMLGAVEGVYSQLARAICQRTKLIVAAPSVYHQTIMTRLGDDGVPLDQVRLYPVNTQDTWARDHGPLTVSDGQSVQLLDFNFNGWGNKYPAELDNQITQVLASQGAFSAPVLKQNLVLEGGALEVDETGALLTTRQCLLNPNRNGSQTAETLEAHLQKALGIRKVNWLDHGYLAGDDTDSHIDTLARLGPDGVLLYVGCDDPDDEHFAELAKMEAQLKTFSNAEGRPYRLFRLPWPKPVFSAAGERLPATYANFLLLNRTVLVPTYADDNDGLALEIIGEAFPGYEIIGIDCRPLIEQHGSLHCVTMQLPVGVIDFD